MGKIIEWFNLRFRSLKLVGGCLHFEICTVSFVAIRVDSTSEGMFISSVAIFLDRFCFESIRAFQDESPTVGLTDWNRVQLKITRIVFLFKRRAKNPMDRAALEAKFGPALLGKEGLILTGSSAVLFETRSKIDSFLALAILKRFNLTAEALSDHWEAFILPRLNGDKSKFVFNGQNLKELEESIAIKSGVQKQVVKDVVKVKNGVRNISGGLDSL